ncbi:hypothetical protein FS837_010046 [Tulasnella sp. UAMH 9824]|nr:hypothetical protein FS837_010046 [Tulasnella sp. UAMH 9824]
MFSINSYLGSQDQNALDPSDTLQNLPTEILLKILGSADSISTIHSVSSVSRHLHDVANSLLYRHVELHHGHRAVFLLSTLIDTPDLGRHIRSFDCSALPSRCRFVNFIANSYDLRPSELAVHALRKAVGLTSLVLAVDVVVDLNRIGWVTLLEGPIELRKLVLWGKNLSHVEQVQPSRRTEWSSMIVDVLKAQPSISELEIKGVEPLDTARHLDPTDLPNLRTLTVSTATALQLVLGGRQRSPRSIVLKGNVTIKQIRKTIFDLIPDGTVVEEFTWQGPITQTPSVAGEFLKARKISVFLSELATRFPNVRCIELPRCRGLWKREEWPRAEWIQVLQEAGEKGKKSEEQEDEDGDWEEYEGLDLDEDAEEEWIEDQYIEPDPGLFEQDLSPLGINHRCYP